MKRMKRRTKSAEEKEEDEPNNNNNTQQPQKQPQKRKKVNRSCHHCRMDHIRCCGSRPCSMCVKKQRQCIDYNSSLVAKKKPTAGPISSSSTRDDGITVGNDSLRSMLQRLKEQVKNAQQYVQEIQQQNQVLQNHLTNNNAVAALEQQQQQQEIVDCRSSVQNQFTINFWNPSSDFTHATYFYDVVSLKLIGCNDEFCRISGYTKRELMNDFHIFNLLPERTRNAWITALKWILSSPIRLLAGCTICYFEPKREEFSMMSRCRFERSFVWVELIPLNYFSDEWIVDSYHLQETIRIPYDENLRDEIPSSALKRLMDLLVALNSQSVNVMEVSQADNTMIRELQVDTSPTSTSSTFSADNTLNQSRIGSITRQAPFIPSIQTIPPRWPNTSSNFVTPPLPPVIPSRPSENDTHSDDHDLQRYRYLFM